MKNYLKDRKKALPKAIEIIPRFVYRRVKVELAPKDLHPEEREDDNEEEQKKQQRGDGLDGI